jgi:hypothetical protein
MIIVEVDDQIKHDDLSQMRFELKDKLRLMLSAHIGQVDALSVFPIAIWDGGRGDV